MTLVTLNYRLPAKCAIRRFIDGNSREPGRELRATFPARNSEEPLPPSCGLRFPPLRLFRNSKELRGTGE
jgi:hypothetical protein